MASRGAAWRREAGYLIELVGVTAVAVAQPVFNVIQQSPEELVNRRAGADDIVLFAVLLVAVPPLVLWLVEQPFRLLGEQARRIVHGVLLGGVFGIFVVEVVKSALGADPRRWLWLLGGLTAAGAAVLLVRSARLRSVFRYLALAAPIFLGVFLFASPVSDLVVAGSVEPAAVDIEDPVPVILIAFDEFPEVSLLDGEGRVDADAFPAFAELAAQSTWFRNNTGVSPVTPSALPAILTGRLPDELFPAPVATKFTESLYTLLGGTYDVDVVETLTSLCSPNICDTEEPPSRVTIQRSLFSLGRSVFESVAKPSSDPTNFEFVIERNPADPQAPARFQAFTRDITQGEGLTLDVGHFLLPHQPWDFLASGRTYTAPDPPRSAEFGDWHDQTTADEGRQRHLAQLQYTDRLLGQALEDLQGTERWDESLVVVTADHGVAFVGGEPLRGVSEENASQVMWTPLFVKLPGQTAGAVDDRATETIDVMPTIADVLNVEIPWAVDGTSVFEPAPDDRPVRMYDWRFNDAEANDDGFVVFERQPGFAEVLATSTPLSEATDDPFALPRLGEFGDLVGQRVEDLDVGRAAAFELTTRAEAAFTVAPDAPDVPAYVEGVWDGEAGGWVAIAVDGTLSGIGRSYRQGDYATVWMLLAEHVFTPGDHELAVYDITGSAAAPVLHPVGLRPWDE